ncbi:MAG: hypothetical protein UX42_C0001G0051 [Microgenomates group bacterium GW2011_GWC1_46_20]|nr:MAG: hypothetical protein UX42_C0001G0051 [Microgenomates group bacterium GW2011_GWC1_46_20]
MEEKQIDSEIQESEIKLNRLLDGYLDQVIEPEVYKQKKNELLNCALQAQKIARAKNNCHDLSIMAKKVGSNFFLMNRRLSANLDYAFRALATGGGVASAPPCESSISFLVTPVGFEPTIFRMRT